MKNKTPFVLILIGTTLVLFLAVTLPPAISNAVLHHRLGKIDKGMSQEEAARILKKEPLVDPFSGEVTIAVADHSSPLATIFPSFLSHEFHVVRIETGRVAGVGRGHWVE